jgi:hypothetical protein
MLPPHRPSIVAALLVLALAGPASPHPSDWSGGPPTTYSALVRDLRLEVRSIDEALRAGNLTDARQHAAEVDRLARDVPTFALTLPGALRDSVVGPILRAGHELGTAASALREAADRGDSTWLAGHAQLLAEPLADLIAYVPRQYVCPMHCEIGITYDRPLRCPVCGMHLQLVTSDRHTVEVVSDSRPIRSREETTLHFQIKDPAGFEVRHLQVVHEKLLHLMIVSHDLSRFEHVHPVPDVDGRFTLHHRFPTGGRYVLFHDFTPDSVGMQVVPVELTVDGAVPPVVPLRVDDDRAKRVDGIDVALAHTPLAPDIECRLTFTLTRGGRPLTDLEPFLGAMGHLVMISEDRSMYVHSHPLETTATGGRVEFKARFERTGRYKAWGQFQRRGRVLTVPFVIDVALDEKARMVDRYQGGGTR